MVEKHTAASPEQRESVLPPYVETASRASRHTIVIAILAFTIPLAIYLLRLDRVVGQFSDDAWYVLLAQALASGQGYTLINSPSIGITPIYPPAFPILLSLAYRLMPEFPNNIWLLKSISIIAMLASGIFTYHYLNRYRELPRVLSLAAALAVVLCPAFVFLATSTVMSECVFTLGQLITVLTIERSLRIPSRRGWLYLLAGALLAAFSFLTRSMAVVLILAIMIYLLKERQLGRTLLFTAVVALLTGPWLLYARLHEPTQEQRQEQNNYIVQSYREQFWMRFAGVPVSGTITAQELPARVWQNLTNIFARNIGGIIVPSLYRDLPESGQEVSGMEDMGLTVGSKVISLVLSIIIVIGFVLTVGKQITLAELLTLFTLIMVSVWPWWPLRFVLPLAPFLLFYLLMGLRAIVRLGLGRRKHIVYDQWFAPRILIGCVIALSLYDHTGYLMALHGYMEVAPPWVSIFKENEVMLQWADQRLLKNFAVAAQNPALVYLYTGHKTIACDDPVGNWENWKRLGVRYIVRTSIYALIDDDSARLVIYRSPTLNLRVVDLGPPATRPSISMMR
ncbi:MAG: glycosyltransferase family 39 protein [Acidobacteriota bacterium]